MADTITLISSVLLHHHQTDFYVQKINSVKHSIIYCHMSYCLIDIFMSWIRKYPLFFGSRCFRGQRSLFDYEYIWLELFWLTAAPSKWLLHWFVVSCLMPITGIFIPQREISGLVSNDLTKTVSIWILAANWIRIYWRKHLSQWTKREGLWSPQSPLSDTTKSK